ncbi:unnamed protein product [Sphagnum compactum]
MEEFVIEAVRAERLRQASGVDMEQFVASLVKPTAAMARAPISKFHVGAVGLGSSGRIFRGVNLEFKGLPLNHSVHAEQFLVANAAQNGEKKLIFIAVSAAPCGHCRQFLQELRAAGDIRILVTDGKDPEPQPLSYFLPHRFGPEDLLHKDFPLLLESRSNGLHPTLTSASAAPVVAAPNGSICTKCDREIAQNALEAANNSYAPYSRCPSGITLATKTGESFSGYYMESAAYNPGLPPLQAAIVAFVCDGGRDYDEIETAILVETKDAAVQQAPTVHLALEKIAPSCTLHVYEVSAGSKF